MLHLLKAKPKAKITQEQAGTKESYRASQKKKKKNSASSDVCWYYASGTYGLMQLGIKKDYFMYDYLTLFNYFWSFIII